MDLALGFATQTPEEFFEVDTGDESGTNAAEVIVSNLSMTIFQYLKKFSPDTAEKFDLTEAEREHVLEAEMGNEQLGYSEALLSIDKKGNYPIRVEMDPTLNPKEFTVLKYDPTEPDHEDDFEEYLRARNDVCDWGWA